MSYKQSGYPTHSTRSDFALQREKAHRNCINLAERWLTAIAITVLLLAYQFSLSQPTSLNKNSDSFQVQTQPQPLMGATSN